MHLVCVFGIETVVCGDISGILSNPISVSLSDNNVEREDIISGNIKNGCDMPMTVFTNNGKSAWLHIGCVYPVVILSFLFSYSIHWDSSISYCSCCNCCSNCGRIYNSNTNSH